MKKVLLFVAAVTIAGAIVLSADWPSSSGNPQRDGWARGEAGLSRASAASGAIKLLYSYRLDTKPQRLGTPVMLTNIASWKGFKALMFIAGTSDVYSIDYQLARPFFRTHLDSGDDKAAAATPICPGGITAAVVMSGSSDGRATAGGSPGPNVWALAADGSLHTLRQQDGDNKATAPVRFIPADSRVSDLNIAGSMIYAATQAGCGGNPNALYAIDLSTPEKKVVSFPTEGSGFAGSGGVAIGNDGSIVYGLLPDTNKVIALGAKDLAVKDYFAPSGATPATYTNAEAPGATPAVFTWKGLDVIVSGGTDGRVCLLDAASLGGSDHHTPLAQSESVVTGDGAIRNAFATWEDPKDSGARWIYVSTTTGIAGLKLEDHDGKPTLTKQWTSRDMIAPAAPAVTNGLVFALSTGQGRTPKNAVLYAIDSATGIEIWSSGTTATSYATAGLAVNASTVMFATHDSQVHAYGIPIIF